MMKTHQFFFQGAALISLLIASVTPSYALSAQSEQATTFEMWPDAHYSDTLPSPQQILGYQIGERITSHEAVLSYFYALEQAAPEQIKVIEYGESWEGRKLIYAVVGNRDHIAKLDNFADKMGRLADPRQTTRSQAKPLIDTLPASVWLQHSVHGNEISSTEAAMMTAYHLLASQDDPMVANILDNTLVFIDPLQNPDGRMRFIHHYYSTVGLKHSAVKSSAEHNEPWPRGRSNHYLFDMNRDWLAITQPETAGRVNAMNHYKPTVVIDLHEMGEESSYFFVPAASPINPHMSQDQLDNNTLIGKNNAKYFDRFGFDYFTREVFDAFYPGYGDSWPTFYGASAATYEVASTRGEVYQTQTGEIIHYRQPIQKHFVASMATLEAAANNRKKILSNFYQYQVDAIEAGKKDKERTFIIPTSPDRAGAHRLATLMAQHGVEVTTSSESFKACGERYQAGTYIIDTAQPRGRFVKTTFTQQVDMTEDFIEEQERRRARKLDDEIYDVTAWSLPLLFNVPTKSCDDIIDVAGKTLSANTFLTGNVSNPHAEVAYIVPWGDAAAGRFLTGALRHGLTLKSADEAFTVNGSDTFPAGSLIIEVAKNKRDLSQVVARLAKTTGVNVTGVNTSWVTDGPSFGSHRTVQMSKPDIALAWDEPTSSLSAGSARFVLERQFYYPVTAIRTDDLPQADLSDFEVLILPEGRYAQAFDSDDMENIKAWVANGGVLITLGSATAFAAQPDIGLLDIKQEFAYQENPEPSTEGTSPTTEGSLLTSQNAFISAIEEANPLPDYVAGVLANVTVDQEHWLTAGVAPQTVALVTGSTIYAPIKLSSGKNLAWFGGRKSVLASGYLWKENQQQLNYKPFLVYQPSGKGMVIGYTQDPTSRAYLDGLNVMFINSVFRAPAHVSH